MRQKGEASKLHSSSGSTGVRAARQRLAPPSRGGEHRRDVDGQSEAQHRGYLTRAVGREEVAYDVVGLVERRTRVGIHEPGKLQAAAPRTHALTMPRPAFRAGVDQRIEVEDREGFAHLPPVRTTLELVELDHPRRLPARPV